MIEKFTILLVDDVSDNLYSLKMLIEDNFDVDIILALSAQEAMEILLKNRVDLILTDVQMPDIDGFEFASYLKELEVTKNIPIVFITGIYDKDEYKTKGYDIGVVEYITKPINNDLLVSKLKIYIDIYESIRESNNKISKTNDMLIHNSKMASMGEMIGLIAHQMKQPLNILSLYCDDMEITYEFGEINKEYMKDFGKNTKEQIKYMNETINGFLDFFNPNKIKKEFFINEAINKALDIMKSKISANKVELNLDLADSLKTFGVEMELTQVILNIVSNSVDAIVQREIKDGKIDIKLYKNENKNVLIIEDNAKGVENNQLEKLLEPYYSTKENGTGVGLYMVKLIIKNSFNADLKVLNSENGLKFIIFLENY